MHRLELRCAVKQHEVVCVLRAGLADFGEASRRDIIVPLPVAVDKVVGVLGLEGGAGARAGHRAAELVVELRRGETVLTQRSMLVRLARRRGLRRHRKRG